eukprot:5672774-Pyramimonas_sp.AAC.2
MPSLAPQHTPYRWVLTCPVAAGVRTGGRLEDQPEACTHMEFMCCRMCGSGWRPHGKIARSSPAAKICA